MAFTVRWRRRVGARRHSPRPPLPRRRRCKAGAKWRPLPGYLGLQKGRRHGRPLPQGTARPQPALSPRIGRPLNGEYKKSKTPRKKRDHLLRRFPQSEKESAWRSRIHAPDAPARFPLTPRRGGGRLGRVPMSLLHFGSFDFALFAVKAVEHPHLVGQSIDRSAAALGAGSTAPRCPGLQPPSPPRFGYSWKTRFPDVSL